MRITIIIVTVVISFVFVSGRIQQDNDDMLRNAMEHMLQIRPPSGKRQQVDDETPNLYMMELYKKYLTSESMKTKSNTIRSIIPQRGKSKKFKIGRNDEKRRGWCGRFHSRKKLPAGSCGWNGRKKKRVFLL